MTLMKLQMYIVTQFSQLQNVRFFTSVSHIVLIYATDDKEKEKFEDLHRSITVCA